MAPPLKKLDGQSLSPNIKVVGQLILGTFFSDRLFVPHISGYLPAPLSNNISVFHFLLLTVCALFFHKAIHIFVVPIYLYEQCLKLKGPCHGVIELYGNSISW